MRDPKNIQSEPKKAHISIFLWFRPVVVDGSSCCCDSFEMCDKSQISLEARRWLVWLIDWLEGPCIYSYEGYNAPNGSNCVVVDKSISTD